MTGVIEKINNGATVEELTKGAKESKKKYQKKYYADNKEYWAKYYAEHKKTISDRRKKKYKENRDKILKRNTKWFKDNKEWWNAYQREYRKKQRLAKSKQV